MPALIKVFVPTYRRPRLLARALGSLRAQTHTDWIAEVHNDDPSDPGPAALVASLADPRITSVDHPHNLGAVATFNLCYGSGPEPFMALLEDDNAWEPTFLAELITALTAHPSATLAWCNQTLDEELPDGSVRDLARTVRPFLPDPAPILYPFGHDITQAFGALHGHGAMLLRRPSPPGYLTPAIPVTGIEPWRERLFPGPLLYLPSPLARFTLTRATARSGDARPWASLQTALVASFARAAGPARTAELWAHARACRPPMYGALLQSGLADPACRHLLRSARPHEWLRWLLGVVRHPRLAVSALRFRHAPWWPVLAESTRARLESTDSSHRVAS